MAKLRQFKTREKWLEARHSGIGANQFTSLPMPDRFWRKTKREGNCLLWTGAINKNGYGSFLLDGKIITASRLAYILTFGPILPIFFVLHTCDNPLCVDSKHLYLGDHRQNMRDKKDRGRGRGGNGERNVKAKLSNNDALVIRSSTLKTHELCLLYGVSKSTVNRIQSRRLWRHL